MLDLKSILKIPFRVQTVGMGLLSTILSSFKSKLHLVEFWRVFYQYVVVEVVVTIIIFEL